MDTEYYTSLKYRRYSDAPNFTERWKKLSLIEDRGQTDRPRYQANTRWAPPLPLTSAARHTARHSALAGNWSRDYRNVLLQPSRQ